MTSTLLRLAIVAGTADLPSAEQRPVEGTPKRDVIATALDALLVTDADIVIADDNAWVISDRGPTLFRYRRIRVEHLFFAVLCC
ncbi:MAG: hypothetical protein AAGD07_24860 [Planctomycetota bacterium]